MIEYPRILTAFFSTPWAILPAKLEEIRALLLLRASGREVSAEQIAAASGSRRPDGVQMAGRVAVMPVFGVLSQRVGSMEKASGGVSAEEVGAKLDALVADRQVRAIVMAFDSPGGSVFGIQELGAKIKAASQEKKIVGLADSVAASAAYWLISQTAEVNITPGGQVGSIGVLAAHQDTSERDKAEGVKTTIITSAPYKAEGAGIEPLGEEARTEIQAKVNHYHGLFVAAVAKGRGVTEHKVESSFGQGRMVTAKEAVGRGMADHVATLDQVIARLGGDTGTAGGVSAMQASARARALEVGL